jgi:DNA ligase-1
MLSLPPLYKLGKSGLQVWAISTEGATIVTRWGLVDGAQQETREEVQEGKNLGKSNATTPEEQASLEAEAKHTKKRKSGYIADRAAAERGAFDDAVISGGVLPMLAHSYDKQWAKVRWPAYVQPKLDGHRCVAVVDNGRVTLWSRTRKPITSMPHIVRALETVFDGLSLVLDGELYNHDLRDQFERLTSLIRSTTPQKGHEVIHYHVYDLIAEGDFVTRHRQLTSYLRHLSTPIHSVPTQLVMSANSLSQAVGKYLAVGYEGGMVRNTTGPYVHGRSYDLLKVKEFDDAEFEITAITPNLSPGSAPVTFTCSDGKVTFDCVLRGPREAQLAFLADPEAIIGRQMTVKFQGRTAEGIPRFPVGLRLRDVV